MLREDCLVRDSDGYAVAPEVMQGKGKSIDCNPFPPEEVPEEEAAAPEEDDTNLDWALYAGAIIGGGVLLVLCMYLISDKCCKYKRWEEQDNSDQLGASD